MGQQDEQFETSLRVSAKRALPDHIPASLRAVSLEMRGTVIHFRAVFDPDASEIEREMLSVAATEVIADFPDPITIHEEYIDLAPPAKPAHLRHVVFLRPEPGPVENAG